MNFFERRPAALAVGISLLAAMAASFAGFFGRIALMIAVLTASLLSALYFSRRPGRRIATLSAFSFVLLAGALTMLQLLSTSALYDLSVGGFERRAGAAEHRLCADVVEVRHENGWSASYDVALVSIDGERSLARGLLLCDAAPGLSAGDRIEFCAGFEPLGEVYSDYGRTDRDLISSGYTFACRLSGEVETVGSARRIGALLSKLRRETAAAVSLFTDSKTAGLVKALLLSDRSGLGMLRRDMERSGVSHLLALSGLHLSVLCMSLERLLKRLGARRRYRTAAEAIVALGFLVLAGFPYSLLRAASMLALTALAGRIGRDSDRITALFVVGYLMVLADPAALADAGFLMSFAATLGILLVYGADVTLRGRLFRIAWDWNIPAAMRELFAGMIVSLGAVMFVTPIQWICFGETSLLFLPATLLLTPLISLTLILAIPYATAAVCGAVFLAGRVGFLLTLLCSLIRAVASGFSACGALVSLRYPFFLPVLLLTAVGLVLLSRRPGADWFRSLGVFGISAMVFLVSAGAYDAYSAKSAELRCFNHSDNDAAAVISGGECLVADISSGSRMLMIKTARGLSDDRVTEIDTCMLTHLHRAHTQALKQLCEERLVRRFLLPEPVSDSDTLFAKDVAELAGELGVTVEYYPRPDAALIDFHGVSIRVGEPEYLERSSHQLIRLDFGLGEQTVTYAGASLWESGQELSGTVVIGTHGPKIKSEPAPASGDSFDIESEELRFTAKP